jgi:hypothetical protein
MTPTPIQEEGAAAPVITQQQPLTLVNPEEGAAPPVVAAAILLTQPLQIHDRCQVQWRGGQQHLAAEIVERRPHRKSSSATGSKRKRYRTAGGDIDVDIDSLPADAVDYYVHYVDHDRCVRMLACGADGCV